MEFARYLVGSFVLVSLAVAAVDFSRPSGSHGESSVEAACPKSGAVKEGPELVRIDPISGPGMCGAQFPLKVAAFGEASALPLAISMSCGHRRISATSRAGRSRSPHRRPRLVLLNALRQPNYGAPSNGPISLSAPGVAPQEDETSCPPRVGRASRLTRAHRPIRRATVIRPGTAPYSQPSAQPLGAVDSVCESSPVCLTLAIRN